MKTILAKGNTLNDPTLRRKEEDTLVHKNHIALIFPRSEPNTSS